MVLGSLEDIDFMDAELEELWFESLQVAPTPRFRSPVPLILSVLSRRPFQAASPTETNLPLPCPESPILVHTADRCGIEVRGE